MGICGSGLVDAVAELLRVGIIDFTGRLCPPLELAGRVDPALASRVKEDERASGLFSLATQSADIAVSVRRSPVAVGQGRNSSRVSILCKRAGISCSEIDTVFLAARSATTSTRLQLFA